MQRKGKKSIKLKQEIFIAFFTVIVVPVLLIILGFSATVFFEANNIREKYGIDIRNLQGFNRALVFYMLFGMITILIISATMLAFWLYRKINTPIQRLNKAAKSIRDGNFDDRIETVSGPEELEELCGMFEQMREQLKKANEEKLQFDEQNRELISNISHDLKTPITAVKGYCEGLMDGVADTPEKQHRYIHTIYNKANDMDHLINELSFYSKITTNRIPYVFDLVNVKNFFDDAADSISDDMTSKGIAFSYRNTVGGDVRVVADVEQIQRVINNIISNSVKYMDKPEKRISLTVKEVGDEIEVALADNGKGIEAKNLHNIFDRFYRTDSSRNSAQGGSGIGLSIVRKIIEDHGGRVWASSKEGEGTTIYFSLRKNTEVTK